MLQAIREDTMQISIILTSKALSCTGSHFQQRSCTSVRSKAEGEGAGEHGNGTRRSILNGFVCTKQFAPLQVSSSGELLCSSQSTLYCSALLVE